MLSRLQFAITIGIHFICVSLSIGMLWLLLAVETLAWITKNSAWEKAGRFFGHIFVTTFAFGVFTELAMEFQFGTNRAGFSNYVGEVFGIPLAVDFSHYRCSFYCWFAVYSRCLVLIPFKRQGRPTLP